MAPARNVSAAARTTFRPSDLRRWAIFAVVVVLPVPLTPTIITMTGVSPASIMPSIVALKSQYPAAKRLRSARFRLASITLARLAPFRKRLPINSERRAVNTASIARLPISASSMTNSNSSSSSSNTGPPLIIRPPFSTTPPPKSISNSTPCSVSTVFLPDDILGACSTSTNFRPVVDLIMWRSTREPSGRVTWLMSNPFLASFFFSFSLRLRSLSSSLRSFFDRVAVGWSSGSSSHSSQSSSVVGTSTGSSICVMSSHSSSRGTVVAIASSASSLPSSAVRASKSVSSASSLTRFLNRSKNPMLTPNHPM